MKWFRSNIKHGSRLALLALALQFGLSFGHFHAGVAPAAVPPAVEAVAAQSDISATADAVEQLARLPASDHDPDHHPSENCAVCAVIALAGTVLFATPPVLRLPQAEAFLYLVTDAAFADLNPVRVAFQPRAPPAS